MIVHRRVIPAALAAFLVSGSLPVFAGKSDDTLTWLSNIEPENIDAYQNSIKEGHILARHIWDALMEVDPKTGNFLPSLAKSFKWVDDTTLRYELRDDVVFHNGEKFSADDVVATMNYLGDPNTKIKRVNPTRFIAGAEKLGPFTVDIKLKYPFPLAPEYFATIVVIYPKSAFKDGAPKSFATKPIGTGPYKVVEISYGKRFVLVKNETYMKGGPKTPHIGRLIFRQVEERGTQLAELLSGGADMIWRVPPDLARKLKGRKGFTVTEGDTIRIAYLLMDAAGKSGDTPMTKLKVRQAISHAIDRDLIRKTLIGASARVLHASCYPTMFGCADTSVQRYAYDPQKAKALLAEAGYPSGFETPLYAYRDRPVAEAIVGQLHAVGVQAKLIYLKSPAVRELRRTRGIPLSFGTHGSAVNDAYGVLANWFEGDGDDHALDKGLIDLLHRTNTTNQEVRRQVFKQALDRIAAQAYWLPLFSLVTNYAYTDQLDFTPDFDEMPRFWNARWK
jgi:peptide/nickel transport system substrate-binding protein